MNSTLSVSKLKRIRYAVFSFYFTQGLCFSTWASRIPDIKNFLNMEDAAWGTILLMIPIGQICGMTLSGLLVSKVGSKPILTIANICYGLMLLVIGFAQTEYALMMSLIAFGFFGNFCNIATNTQGITIEQMYDKPIMASFHGGWSLAGLTGASIGLLMSGMMIQPIYHFSVVVILVLINNVINNKYLQPDIKRVKSPEEIAERKKNKPENFLYMLGLVAFCGMAAEGAMSDWSGVYMQKIVGVSEHLAPMGLTAYMITMATGRFVVDRASQRWGQQRIIQCGGLLIFIGLFLAVILPYTITTLIGFMVIGFGTCSIVPTIYSIAGKKTRIPTGLALTIVSSISFLGFLLGPPVIGYISQVSNLRFSYALVGMFGLCIVILASRLDIFKQKKDNNE